MPTPARYAPAAVAVALALAPPWGPMRRGRSLIAHCLRGLVATVAVSWLAALMSPLGPATSETIPGAQPTPFGEFGLATPALHTRSGPGIVRFECFLAPAPEHRPPVDELFDVTTVGWPLRGMTFATLTPKGERERALRPDLHDVTRPGTALSMGLPVPSFVAPFCADPRRRIPLMPAWPEFVADLAFWSAVSGFTSAAVTSAIHRSRRRAGRCPSCGFPRPPHGTPCSECGAA